MFPLLAFFSSSSKWDKAVIKYKNYGKSKLHGSAKLGLINLKEFLQLFIK